MSTSPEVDPEIGEQTTESGAAGNRSAGPGGIRNLVDMSRRRFLATGSIGVAAAGVAAAVPGLPGLLASAEDDAPAASSAATAAASAAPEAEGVAGGAGQQIMAHVSDLSTGEMRIFSGSQTLTIRDPGLASRLAQAIKAAGG